MKRSRFKSLNIKGALLEKSSLCSYLEKVAAEQTIKNKSDDKTYPIDSLKENFEVIDKTYAILNAHAKLKIAMEPAGEWLLDNFYIIEEITKHIEKELTKKKYKNLKGIADGKYKGFARIYVLAQEITAYTDGKIDEDSIKDFLISYQKKKLLTIEEIWSFPIFLQLSIIQNISQICEKIYISQIQKYKVESIIERLVDKKDKAKQLFSKNAYTIRNYNVKMSYAFIEHLSYKLKSYGKRGTIYLNILENQVNKMGSTIADVIKQVHFSYAVNKVSIGNLITSIKEVSHIDFGKISRQIGGIENVLLKDPAGIYEKMDYNTKSDYQSKIREISDKTNISEIYIAKTLIKLCKEKDKNDKASHIGYYLYEDINELYKKLDINKKVKSKEKKKRIYISTNIILPLYLCLIFFAIIFVNNKNFILSMLSAILMYFAFSEITTQTIMHILSILVKPKRIPKLDFSMGVPKEAATFVVIPTILSNTEKVKELADKLEIYYLANKSDNIYFAILGDVSSGSKEEEPEDNKIIQEGINQIKILNHKYHLEKFDRFHFLYRKRAWNPKEECYLGWERKRGLLIQFNEFLLDNKQNDFKYNSLINKIQSIPEIKYVITLDSDTNLVLNSGLELIGAMEHILNTPIIENGIVTSGHAIIEPRVGVDLTSNYSSWFSKIFAGIGGTDLYTNAISDVYQDNFGEGIFAGKGIYNLKVFSKLITNQIPENTVLSHDLLEGSYLRCGLASDILVLDGFPSKYYSYMTRLSRWIRGDWQIIRWTSKKTIIRNGSIALNPLNELSKYKIYDNLRRSIIPINAFLLLVLGMIKENLNGLVFIFMRINSNRNTCNFGFA